MPLFIDALESRIAHLGQVLEVGKATDQDQFDLIALSFLQSVIQGTNIEVETYLYLLSTDLPPQLQNTLNSLLSEDEEQSNEKPY